MIPVKVTLHELTNAGEKQKNYVSRAVTLLEEVVNSKDFRDAVAQAKFSHINRSGGDNRRESILRYLLEGVELGTAPDNEIDLRINLRTFYYGFGPFRTINKKTVGSANLGGPVIHTNYYHINDWILKEDVASGVGHWLHEWMHVAGYSHATAAGDENDVAYAIGALAENIAWKRLGAQPRLTAMI
jgi:hypothetical protein